jgi:RimJ/RimL family protein N-acetyltransferase
MSAAAVAVRVLVHLLTSTSVVEVAYPALRPRGRADPGPILIHAGTAAGVVRTVCHSAEVPDLTARAMTRSWPVFGLRLTIADLTLRPFTEDDLEELADSLPDDVELNPDTTTYDIDEDTARRTQLHQEYWQAMGNWTPQKWRLNFTVRRGDAFLGAQEIEGTDFPTLRTVDSASFLVRDARGKGTGTLMRRAMLALAFGPLGAQYAISSAWPDNWASLGVSRSLGYLPNGLQRQRRGDGADDLVHLRLTRQAWVASGLAEGVRIEGFEPCRPYFGL